MKSAERQPITFKTTGEASDASLKSADSRFRSYVSGLLVVGENEYKADLFFTVRKSGEGVSFIGNIVISESSFLTSAEGEVVTIHIKGRQ